jgi:hypothetical protein
LDRVTPAEIIARVANYDRQIMELERARKVFEDQAADLAVRAADLAVDIAELITYRNSVADQLFRARRNGYMAKRRINKPAKRQPKTKRQRERKVAR